MKKRKIGSTIATVVVLLALIAAYGIMIYQKVTNPGMSFVGTYWALLPPVTAIGLALVTKEVYSSLFLGIVSGALLVTDFNIVKATETLFTDGLIASVADSWNVGILVFLVALGIIVALVNSAGGSSAYGKWASKAIKSRRAAQFATFGLGALIFVDDYFNCLTVGSVMRPVT
ncbi:MAG: Na+/H+ antiporter NhaC family protein, partial [Clostridia bacterium]|nr:Na+/H+ antiporter NhaC family protein [Clostridia bacterium]